MQIITEREIRKQAALHAFWSHHPLVEAYRAANLAEDVSLHKLIAFVTSMPQAEFTACMLSAHRR